MLRSTDYLRVLRSGRLSLELNSQAVSSLGKNQKVTFEGRAQVISQRIKVITRQSRVGSDVFINYVREYFQEEFESNRKDEESLDEYINRQMTVGKSRGLWIDRINKKAQSWSVIDAGLLLSFLEEDMEIEPSVIINMLKSAVSFFGTVYESFMSRINIYYNYLTKEEIRSILEKHFSAFQFGRPDNIIKMMSLLEGYVGKESAKQNLKDNLKNIAIASGRLSQLGQNIAYLEKYLGKGDLKVGKDKLSEIIKNGGFQGIIELRVYIKCEW